MIKYSFLLLSLLSFSAYAQETKQFLWDDARINGKMELTVNRRDFEAVYKKADSIVTPDYMKECGAYEEETFQYYYHKGLKYEMDNGVLNFRYVIFKPASPLYFTYKDMRFDGKTKAKDFDRLFPEAENWESTEFENMTKLKAKKVDSNIPDDDSSWIFYFKNGLLVAIQWFYPCYG